MRIRPHQRTDTGAADAAKLTNHLDLELPPGRELIVQHRRLADELNAQWIARYQAELLHPSPLESRSPATTSAGT